MSGGSMEQTTTGLSRRRLLATLGSAAVAGAALGGVEALRPGADSMARASTVVPTGTSPYGFNVIDYGAVPNRSVDSSAAFPAAALAASTAGGGGLLVKASDASFANLYIGGNTGGPNIEVYGSVNHFVNCKSFWGDPNWKIEGYDVTLDSCESQDSSGYGLDVMFGSVVAKSFVSNGDLRACRVSGAVDGYNGGYNDIDMSVCAADRYLSVVGFD